MDNTVTKAIVGMKAASNSDDQGGKLNVYLPAGYIRKIDQLLDALTKQGVDLGDPNRRIPSKSKLIQHLIDEELSRLGIKTE